MYSVSFPSLSMMSTCLMYGLERRRSSMKAILPPKHKSKVHSLGICTAATVVAFVENRLSAVAGLTTMGGSATGGIAAIPQHHFKPTQ